MRQYVNTALLLAILGLLVFLILRPQPGRYQWVDDAEPYLLDTATGELVVLGASEEARAHYQKRKAEERERKEEAREAWLDENCAAILAGRSRGLWPGTWLPPDEGQRRECEEWWMEKYCPAILAGTVLAFPPGLGREDCKEWQQKKSAAE